MYCVRFVLTDGGIAPTRATDGSIGWDIYSPTKQIIPAGKTRKLCTGVSIEMTQGVYCRLYGRSSLALRGLVFNTGIIDTDYRGEVCAMAYNTLTEPFFFAKGERIGQLVFDQYVETKWEQVEVLTPTTRGVNGFGSTGR